MSKCAAVYVILAALPFTQCLGPKDGQVCTEVYVYGLTVNVTDAQTGASIEGATLTLREGNYVEVMHRSPPGATSVQVSGREPTRSPWRRPAIRPSSSTTSSSSPIPAT